MNKKELISAVAEQTSLSKKDVESAFGAIFQTIKGALSDGSKISIKGFGTFSVKKRAAKTGRHPKTGQKLQIPERTVPVFSAGSDLKDVVANPKKAAAAKKKAAAAAPAPKKKAAAPKKKAAAPKKKAAAAPKKKAAAAPKKAAAAAPKKKAAAAPKKAKK